MAEYKNNYWMILSLVLLTALVTFGVTYYVLEEWEIVGVEIQESLPKVEDVETVIPDEESANDSDDLDEPSMEYDLPAAFSEGSLPGYWKYTDALTGLSFEYPDTLGWVTTNLNEGGSHFQLLIDGNAFMAASNGGPIEGRDGYWGDEASQIVGLDYMFNNLCPKEGVVCEDLMSDNGVRYFKVSRKTFDWNEGGEVDTVDYLIFNEGSEFRGVIFSSLNLKPSLGNEAMVILDGIVKSLSK